MTPLRWVDGLDRLSKGSPVMMAGLCAIGARRPALACNKNPLSGRGPGQRVHHTLG